MNLGKLLKKNLRLKATITMKPYLLEAMAIWV